VKEAFFIGYRTAPLGASRSGNRELPSPVLATWPNDSMTIAMDIEFYVHLGGRTLNKWTEGLSFSLFFPSSWTMSKRSLPYISSSFTSHSVQTFRQGERTAALKQVKLVKLLVDEEIKVKRENKA
jgi:hypothetical protein